MTSLRIFFNALLVMLLVFAAGIFVGPRLAQRPPLPLAIPHPVVDEFTEMPNSVAPIDRDAAADPTLKPRSDVAESPHEGDAALKGVDLKGRLHRLGETDECRAVVLVFLGTECPIANSMIPRLNQLADECRQQHVEFCGVLSSPSLTHRAAVEHSREFSISFPMLFDVSGELRARLGATHSPHAFILTPFGRVLYRGAVDDQFVSAAGRRRDEPRTHWLRDSIRAVINRQPITQSETEPIGCLLQPFSPRPQPTFEREIAPLVFTQCANCHQSGAVAPFALTSYDDLRRHAAQAKIMVTFRQMPPWRPTREFGHFRNELCLSTREIALFEQWIADGMPRGDVAHHWDIPDWTALTEEHAASRSSTNSSVAPSVASDSRATATNWQLGKPDLVLKVPESFSVPAASPDIYQYFVIPTGLTEDRLISAIEYRSNNARVVHHASFRFDDAGNAQRLDDAQPGLGYRRFGGWGFETGGTLGGWAFGLAPQRFPRGLGRPITAGSDFVLQTHYHPTGKPESEQAEIGIHFAPTGSTQHIGELIIADQRLRIPANDERFVHRTSYELPVAVTAYSILPHTHLLGRQTKAVAVLPDGAIEPLILIEDWRFNWQNQYFFKQPRHWPAGTRIEFEVVFDNSASNPLNPHAVPQWVHWGEETTQEMAVLFIDVSAHDDVQLNRLIAHNRAVQSAQSVRVE